MLKRFDFRNNFLIRLNFAVILSKMGDQSQCAAQFLACKRGWAQLDDTQRSAVSEAGRPNSDRH
jgi:hypothetical protein